MEILPEVEAAIQEITEGYADADVSAVPDGQGGAYVTVDPVNFGSQYTPSAGWIKFNITFQYPTADVYPHFIPPEIVRKDGVVIPGQPLGEATSLGTCAYSGVGVPAIQISRRSNGLNPATDTAALTLEKVLVWLRSR